MSCTFHAHKDFQRLTIAAACCCAFGLCQNVTAAAEAERKFNPETDLISLHYDHAPDQDDGHSAVADRTVLEAMFGKDWIPAHVVPVSGAYGTNKKTFNAKSDAVMRAVWDDRGGWLSAHDDWDAAVDKLAARWGQTLTDGGDVWVKEGGQSDITAAVVRQLKQTMPDLDAKRRIHVVQHSDWNEKHTTPAALSYTKEETHYIRIGDANRYLDQPGGNAEFVGSATSHPVFGASWKAAFAYYDPGKRLDFSDTGELFHILELGELDIESFRKKFLAD